MLGGMSRLAAIALCLVCSTAAAGPRGRVQRVEGPGPVGPTLCTITDNATRATCIGGEPRVGQTLTVVGTGAVLGEIEIRGTGRHPEGCPIWHDVETRPVRGAMPDPGVFDMAVGVRAPGLDPVAARTFEMFKTIAEAPDGEEPFKAVDRDGDGVADIVVTRGDCTPAESDKCLHVWTRVRKHLVQTAQLSFTRCVR